MHALQAHAVPGFQYHRFVGGTGHLQAATRGLGCQIVVSDAVVSRVGDAGSGMRSEFRRVPALSLRGREAPIDVWVA